MSEDQVKAAADPPPEKPGRTTKALVLAAGRRGSEDSVAQLQNKTHKCLVEIDGRVMLERVVESLLESGRIDCVLVSIEREDLLGATPKLGAWLDSGRMRFTPSRETLADSVFEAVRAETDPYPMVITTGDNVLHTPEFLREFTDRALASRSDLLVAFTERRSVHAAYPHVELNWHRLKDGDFSSCNVYGLTSERGMSAVDVFRGGGQFGKRHWRILKAFGLMPFLLYKTHSVTAETIVQRIAKNLSVRADLVILDYPFGPIDVDNPRFYRIAEDILKQRRTPSRSRR